MLIFKRIVLVLLALACNCISFTGCGEAEDVEDHAPFMVGNVPLPSPELPSPPFEVPIRVSLVEPMVASDGTDFAPLTREAIAFWNSRLGCEALVEAPWTELRDTSPIYLASGSEVLAIRAGGVYAWANTYKSEWRRGGIALDAERIVSDLTDTAIARLIPHELGHVLGLEHTSKIGCLMSTIGQQPEPCPEEVELVRQRLRDLGNVECGVQQ
jgi:hypothetical protein